MSGGVNSAPIRPRVSVGERRSGVVRYRECLKNHAVSIGGHAVDGCGEFMAAGEEGTLDALKCAACNCHRNFHRKETDVTAETMTSPTATPSPAPPPPQQPPSQASPAASGYHPHHQHQHQHVSQHYRPLAVLPSTSGGTHSGDDMSHPSSSGGEGRRESGVGGSAMMMVPKKRHRTKFTQEQKDKMLAFAEKLGWRIQKHDEAAVQQFCAEVQVKRQVLKVWMHNNKHTLGKKP
ncbi:Zinc-finger homeodomain protein 1 [Bienertia sinuspersici]